MAKVLRTPAQALPKAVQLSAKSKDTKIVHRNVDNQFPEQAIPAGFPAYPAFSPLQMLWWQQMYAHQYYMQYQAAVSAQATSNANSGQPTASQPLNLAHVPGEEPPPAPNLVARENQPVNENVQMNAQGGPVLNEEDFNRDWHQDGWFPFQQEGGQQQASNNNARINNDGQNANNVELEEMERLMDDGLEDESGEDASEDASAIQRPGLMASAWSFITTFFTIPEGPPQVAN
ncbi:homocysteine-responsive endoplasmic reticulum-resident ubiquitin-like domain member 2 protein [Nycticebus coucang]|uniref:homocysteine-responsive endoplasmic reticulum-resident ubiquitin-like domain member 2 protein n=1 Tax=Nycticebus coucang TaxID=9470 RepID=UPI00234C1347|nr:homocysteine-responsive endoplasmic reticulum-resident ubiquitin-like domain member 2 protein [Nycticebus coucang]